MSDNINIIVFDSFWFFFVYWFIMSMTVKEENTHLLVAFENMTGCKRQWKQAMGLIAIFLMIIKYLKKYMQEGGRGSR